MARYRKISVQIWSDAKFRALPDSAKMAFIFVLTHPGMTSVGAMRGSIAGLAAEIGWTEKAFREAFREVFRKGLLEADEKACLLVVPNFIRHNKPESPNVVRSWESVIDCLPECALLTKYLQQVKGFMEALPEGFMEALPEGFGKGMPNPELELEPEQEPEQDLNTVMSVSGKKTDELDAAFEAWWARYPNKTGKGGARKSFRKLKPNAPTVGAMLLALDWQIPMWAGKDYKYVPGPAKYLNEERWTDDRPKRIGDEYSRPDDPLPFA